MNDDCRRIFDSLLKDPSLSDLVVACSKVGSVEHKIAAMATVMKSSPRSSACEESGHVKTQRPQTAGQCVRSSWFGYRPGESSKTEALEIFGVDNYQYINCASACKTGH